MLLYSHGRAAEGYIYVGGRSWLTQQLQQCMCCSTVEQGLTCIYLACVLQVVKLKKVWGVQ